MRQVLHVAEADQRLIARLEVDADLDLRQQDHLVAYIDVLPRDLRFGMVKALLRNPKIAAILCQDKYDATILETIRKISQDVA